MRVIALASGSSGNATLVISAAAMLLFDAGLSPRKLEKHLGSFDIHPTQLDAVFLTHEHADHMSGAELIARKYGIRVVANEATLRAAGLSNVERATLRTGQTTCIGNLQVTSFRLPHDAVEPVGYSIAGDGACACLATDLGHPTAELRGHISAADLVILESNYDLDQLISGPYTAFLKTRIAGKSGHLSNKQAAECLVASVSRREQSVWLAHLSAVNNSPSRAERAVADALRSAGITSVRLAVALRDRPSLIWDSDQCLVQHRLGF